MGRLQVRGQAWFLKSPTAEGDFNDWPLTGSARDTAAQDIVLSESAQLPASEQGRKLNELFAAFHADFLTSNDLPPSSTRASRTETCMRPGQSLTLVVVGSDDSLATGRLVAAIITTKFPQFAGACRATRAPGPGGRVGDADPQGRVENIGTRGEPKLSLTAARELAAFIKGGFNEELKKVPAKTGAHVDVKTLSPFLAAYRSEAGRSVIEVPGQYTGLARPVPAEHATVVSVDPVVLVLSSMRKPKRLILNGSDGRDYKFLVKVRPGLFGLACAWETRLTAFLLGLSLGRQGGEDLRLDERVQQLFVIVNGLLRRVNEPTMRTYQVPVAELARVHPRRGVFTDGVQPSRPLLGYGVHRSSRCRVRSALSSGSTTRRRCGTPSRTPPKPPMTGFSSSYVRLSSGRERGVKG